jgi:nitrite reductase/ring-hydroxylating ferredoxin subunit
MDTIQALPPFPNGWFAVAFSHELRPGRLLSVPFMGQELIVFRTRSGAISAVDPYCPHLGAHFGYGGTVEGEALRCPFHDFRFDLQGTCVATGYGTRPPPKARLRVWPVREVNGVIVVYHDGRGDPPEWEVPQRDAAGWTPLMTRTFTLRSHPQETTENSVDIGHLRVVHGYHAVEALSELHTDGPYLKAHYTMTRPIHFLGATVQMLRSEFFAHVHGLGYSLVEVSVPAYGLNSRLFVLPTPTDGQHIHLRIALSMKKLSGARRDFVPFRFLPGILLDALIPRFTFEGFAHDVGQDFEVWNNKVYVQPPALAEGDGPIGRYRQWTKQFYANQTTAVPG